MCIRQKVTHPKSLNDQVSGLQLTLHDAQESQELWLAQVVHVQFTFLKHTDTENNFGKKITTLVLDNC